MKTTDKAELKTGDGSDEQLIGAIVKGDRELFEVLIRRYNPVLYKIARGYGFGHHDAEDLMQETHLAAYRQLSSFAFRSTYKTWISRILLNLCWQKRNSGQQKEGPALEPLADTARPLFSGEEQPDSYLLKKEGARFLERSLSELPVIYRTVFLLRMVEGFSVQETAELLGISAVNVKVRTGRARALLQKKAEEFYSKAELFPYPMAYCNPLTRRIMEQIRNL